MCGRGTVEAAATVGDRVTTDARGAEHLSRLLQLCEVVDPILDPTGQGRTQWTMRWKPALNAFAITFADRWPAAETY